MSQYCIEWRNKENGRSGRGTKLFEQAEAQLLAQELNGEFPLIEHWPAAALVGSVAAETWRVFKMNDCDWWLARSLEEAREMALREYGDKELIEEARELTPKEMEETSYRLEEWECDCGLSFSHKSANPDTRWNGDAWEHSHGYPVGHVAMRNKISFREALERRIKEGNLKPELFASTEI